MASAVTTIGNCPCFHSLIVLYLIAAFQLWAISETKAPGASVGLQRHDVPGARRAPDPHPLPLQSFRDDGRALHLLRVG